MLKFLLILGFLILRRVTLSYTKFWRAVNFSIFRNRIILTVILSPHRKFMKNKTTAAVEKAKTRLAPSANYFLKNPFAHHQTHDGSQDDSSFTFLDLSRLQSSPTTSLAAPSQWATKLILNCAGFWKWKNYLQY